MQQIECPKCNESFELDTFLQGRLAIECPKCRQQIKITKKITNVTLSKQYKTYIDENKNLVIEKKMFDWGNLFSTILAIITFPAVAIFIWKNSDTLSNESFIIFLKEVYFSDFYGILCFLFFSFIISISICRLMDILFNTTKIVINNTDIDISVYPLKLSITIAEKIPSQNITQIFCKEKIRKNRVEYSVIALNKVGGELLLGTFDQLEETRALEILIEKRLGIKDEFVEDEILA